MKFLTTNFDELYVFLKALPYNPDVICLLESRLKHQPRINIIFAWFNLINLSWVMFPKYVAYITLHIARRRAQNRMVLSSKFFSTFFDPYQV